MHIFWDQPSCRTSPVSHGTWRSFLYGSALSLVSCLPALGAESLGALGGWVGIKILFSDLTCGGTALKPCTQTGVCGACVRSLGALGTGSGLLQAPHWFFLWLVVSFVVRAAYNVMYDRYFFPASHTPCSIFFQASRPFAVAFGFRHYWGVCLHLLLWNLLSHLFLHPVP